MHILWYLAPHFFLPFVQDFDNKKVELEVLPLRVYGCTSMDRASIEPGTAKDLLPGSRICFTPPL